MPVKNPKDLMGGHASATFNASHPSISGSNFGPHNRIVQGDVINLQGEGKSVDEFLQGVSNIDSRNGKVLVDGRNEEWRRDAFNELLERPILDYMGDPVSQFLWIQDSTGAGHPLLVSKLIDKISQIQVYPNLLVAYIFCGEVGNETSTTITATEVIEGLLRSLLQAISDNFPESVIIKIQEDHEKQIKSCRGQKSEFHVLAKMLSDVVKRAISPNNTETPRRPILIIDGLQHCSADVYGNDVSDILKSMKSAARNFTCLTWIFSGPDSTPSSIKNQVRKLDVDFNPVNINPLDTAEALGLMGVIEAVNDTALRLRNTHRELQRQRRNAESLDWFPHCTIAHSWLKPTASAPGDSSQLIWYRRSQQSPLDPSPLGLAMSVKDEFGDREWARFYFSAASIFDHGADSSHVVGYQHISSCQLLWYLLTLLITWGSDCNQDESAIAATILRSPPEARKDLREVCAELQREGNGRPNIIDLLRSVRTPKGQPSANWHQKTRKLGDEWRPAIESSILAFLQHFRESQNLVFIIDCLEVLAADQYMKLLDFFWDIGSRVRVLFCLNPLPQMNEHGTVNWRMRLGGTCVDEHTEFQEFLQSLQFDHMHRRRDEIAKALDETNLWLKDNPDYKKWEAQGSLLWISGKAGSGKSVLAKSILQNLGNLTQREWVVCSWFYTARGSSVGMQHECMLRTLAFQIVSSEEKAFIPARVIYRDLLQEHRDRPPQWTYKALHTLLLKLSSASTTPHTLALIDAFDESETGTARSRALETLGELSQLRGRVRVILLSRDEPDYALQSRYLYQISMQAWNAGDIDTLITHRIGQLRGVWNKRVDKTGPKKSATASEGDATAKFDHWDVTEPQLHQLKHSIQAKASGVILWVTLVFEELESDMIKKYGITPSQLKEIIEGLPPKLEDLYYHALEKVWKEMNGKPEHINVAKDILTWTIGSRNIEPLQLDHLWEAIALPKPGDERIYSSEVISDHRISTGGNWWRFRDIVRQYCGPLVEFIPIQPSSTTSDVEDRRTKPDPFSPAWSIQLVHQTVNVFLQDADRSKHWHINPDSAESRVKAASYRYLGFSESQSRISRPMMKVQSHGSFSCIRCAFVGILEHPIQLFAMEELVKKRPLTSFALSVVYRHSDFKNSVIETFTGTGNPLNQDLLAHCAADLLFAPLSPGTSLGPIVRCFCSNGKCDLLDEMFKLADDPQKRYGQLWTHNRGFVKGRDLEILEGSIEVLEALQSDSIPYWPCFWKVARSLRRLYERHTASHGWTPRTVLSRSPMTKHDNIMKLLDQISDENSGPQHVCTKSCSQRMCRIFFADGTTAWSATSEQVNSALARVIAWFDDRQPRFKPFPLRRVTKEYTRTKNQDNIRVERSASREWIGSHTPSKVLSS